MNCITLLSDFGSKDATVATAKGVLMQYTAGIDIVDITHEISPFQVKEAGYILATTYKNFPLKTCHVVLLDIFSELTPKLILCEYEGHYFLVPDNGILQIITDTLPSATWLCREFSKTAKFTDWLNVAGSILSGLINSTPESLSLPKYELEPLPLPKNDIKDATIVYCDVLYIDRYGNVVINMTRSKFDSLSNGRAGRIEFKQVDEVAKISDNYNDVRDGDKLCRFNSSGYLEICINNGSASDLFGLRLGSKNNNIKIVFQ